MPRSFVIFWISLLLAGCSSVSVPKGPEAYQIVPAPSGDQRPAEYRIGPLDVLKITVFQEEDLSFEEVPVDASGNVLFPLIGKIEASGKTTSALSDDIANRLEERFLVDPQVSIIVSKSVSQVVTVEGSVKKPGVYPIQGATTLLQSMALAEGPTPTAQLSEIVVFRRINDKVFGAAFDLSKIRTGDQPNPEILGGDIVVVGHSFLKGAFRDFLQISPTLAAVFVQL
ncbi:MAG: polysaccharide biosynthesis/export family protein [Parasphingorhabdus sp.]|nr:polysaccharide biosynthesis/export family protein [Parasphingorhabdus sp.]